jgi:hypothetical protein
MNWNTVVQRAPRQVSCALREEVAVLNLATGTYFGLDPVAAFIWSRLESPQTMSQLRAAVMGEYEVEPERCGADLLQFIDDMLSAGLLTAGGQAGDDVGATGAPTAGV